MRKLLVLAVLSLGLAAAGCHQQIEEPEMPAEIGLEFKRGSNVLPADGGDFRVYVYSRKSWTLGYVGENDEEECAWVRPSVWHGEDDDYVRFKVQPNKKLDELVSEWVFSNGDTDVSLTISIMPAEKGDYVLEVNPKDMLIAPEGTDGKPLNVLLKADAPWTLAPVGDYDWISTGETGGDGDDKDVAVRFSAVGPNESGEQRVAEFVFASTMDEKLKRSLRFTQEPLAVQEDELELGASEKSFDRNGGTYELTFYCNTSWSLDGGTFNPAGDETWCTADKTEGEGSGKIAFTVLPNETAGERSVVYRMTAGAVVREFKVISTLKSDAEGTFIEVISTNPLFLDYASGGNMIKLLTSDDVDYLGVKCDVQCDDGGSWLRLDHLVDPGEDNTAGVELSYDENTSLESRTAVVTLGYEGAENVTVAVTQFPKPVLEVGKTVIRVDPTAGTVTIPVRASVPYEVSVEGGWLENHTSSDGDAEWPYNESWTYGAIDAGDSRDAVITFTEVNEQLPPERRLKVTVRVKQTMTLITCVAEMTDARARLKDPGKAYASGIFRLGHNLTMEAYVKRETRDGDIYQPKTIAGIERRFLVRYGDNGTGGIWEAVIAKKWTSGEPEEFKIRSSKELPLDEWCHVAVTLDGSEIVLYQDGEEVARQSFIGENLYDIDLGDTYKNGAGWLQLLSLSFANDGNHANRCFGGKMAEVRIWNRALSSAEINARNHFYRIDNPESADGLVAYWKLNDGNGTVVKDYSGNGNDMTGEAFFSAGGWQETPFTDKWVKVDLP